MGSAGDMPADAVRRSIGGGTVRMPTTSIDTSTIAPSTVPSSVTVAGGGEPVAGSRGTGHRAGWTIVDQLLSSIANFGLTIAVARAVDEHVGGAFTYAFLIFSLLLGLMHAISTDPLVIRFSAVGGGARDQAIRQAAGSTVLLGVLAGLLCAAAGLLISGDLGLALALLGVVLPGHFLQDGWRRAAFAAGEPRKAATSDAARLAVQFVAIGLCVLTGTTDLSWYMLSWALGVWAGALVGVRQFGLPRSWRGSTAWLRSNAPLSVRLGGDFAISMGSFTLTTSLLAVILGLAATGGLRFAQTLLGPIQVLFGAVVSFAIPVLARRLAGGGTRTLRRPSVLLALGCATLSAGVVGILLLLPDAVGAELLGDSWSTAQEVLLPVGAIQVAQAVLLCLGMPLKVMGRADLLLRVTALQAPLSMTLALGGAYLTGITGAAWGLAIGHGVGCLLMLFLANRAMKSGRVGPALQSG